MLLDTSGSDCKVIGNVAVKPLYGSLFSSSVAFLMKSVDSQKPLVFNTDFSSENGLRSARTRPGYYGGCYIVVTLFFANKSLTKMAGVLEHCCEVETNCWLAIFYALPSNPIPKATTDINVYLSF